MDIISPGFEKNSTIPPRYTCLGENMSPELVWKDVPQGTRSLALIVMDPDAPKGIWTHWVAYNIPSSKRGLPAHLPQEERFDGMLQGLNDFGKTGYGGPCPPQGHGPHRYIFKLYALDTKLNLKPGARKEEVEEAMRGHVLNEAQLMGRFEIQ